MDTDILREILKWQKLQGMSVLKPLLTGLLDSKEKRKVYELTNGSLSVTEISKKVGVATGTISNWWTKWLSEGIVEKNGKQYIGLISLKDIDLKEE